MLNRMFLSVVVVFALVGFGWGQMPPPSHTQAECDEVMITANADRIISDYEKSVALTRKADVTTLDTGAYAVFLTLASVMREDDFVTVSDIFTGAATDLAYLDTIMTAGYLQNFGGHWDLDYSTFYYGLSNWGDCYNKAVSSDYNFSLSICSYVGVISGYDSVTDDLTVAVMILLSYQ